MIDTLNSLINNDINNCDKDDDLFLINMIEKSKICTLSIEKLEDMKQVEVENQIELYKKAEEEIIFR